MTVRDFADLQKEVFRLHAEEAYREALALIDQEAGRFADHAADLYYWRACLACRADGADAGLRWLQAAADAGLWYHDRILNDPDLAPLRGDPRLEPLLALFRGRREAAQAQSRPVLHTYEPEGAPRGLLLALHGAGSGFEGHLERPHWISARAAGWRVALAQSSQVWTPGRYFWGDRDRALAEVSAHLDSLGPHDPTVLAGFSAGAAVAMFGVLSGALTATRFLAVAPAIRPETFLPLLAGARGDVRGYIVIGEGDWAFKAAREFASAMTEAGLTCELEVHPGLGHDYPPDFAARLQERLAALSSPRPA